MQTEDFKKYSKELGWLDVAGAEVWQDFEPSDEESHQRIEEFAIRLCLGEKHLQKKVMCLSDTIMAAKHTSNGLISIMMDSNHYRGAAYGYAIMVKVKKALEQRGYLNKVQPAHKKEGLCALYSTAFPEDLLACRFKCHRKGRPVEVRSGRRLDENGRPIGGQRLGLKQFGPSIKRFADEVLILREGLKQHPLMNESGREYGGMRRIFNQGKLNKGGRVYGTWQQLSEDERLKLTMGGKKVAEIDLKGAFLNISAACANADILSFDPYADISFVASVTDPGRKKQARELAKLLTSAYLSNGGRTARFPKGKKKRGIDGRLRVVPIREKFNLPKSARAADYYAAILKAFPFLRDLKTDAFDLMFIESELMMEAMLELSADSIPTAPVHDCLMCREQDVDQVVAVLQGVMVRRLGRSIAMDVTLSNGEVQKIEGFAISAHRDVASKSYPHIDWGIVDDFDLIED
jgi:hypothetical protein